MAVARHDHSAIASVPAITNFSSLRSLVSAAIVPPTQPKDVVCKTNLEVPPASADTTAQASLTPRQQMLSSGAGALLVTLFMTPLDVVKIR
jgi:hypothetical protein